MLGKNLIFIGLFIAAIGVVVTIAGRLPFFGKLPGDILIKRDHFTFYFPLTTCILISVLIMILSRFFGHK